MNIHRSKMTEIDAMPEGWGIVGLGSQRGAIQHEKVLPQIYQTHMARIKPIYTDYQIRAYPRQPLRQLTSPTRMALAIRGDPCSIPIRDSDAINNELVRTETNSGYSKFGG